MGFYTSALKKRKPAKLSSSGLDVSTSAFAAMLQELKSNQFKKNFEVFDKNLDGRISNFELNGLLSTTTKKAEEKPRAMDGNGDGFIDVYEFMEAINGETGYGSEQDDLRDAFAIYDIDSNGKISAQELQLVLISLGSNKCSLVECRRMIKGVDKDGDGFVDLEEFQLMMTKEKKGLNNGSSIQLAIGFPRGQKRAVQQSQATSRGKSALWW